LQASVPATHALVLGPTSATRLRSPSTAQTVEAMEAAAKQDQAHPLVRAFAGRAIQRASASAPGPPSVLDVVKAVEELAAEEVTFVRDPINVELVQTPSYLLSLPQRGLGAPMGDCDELATLVASALMSIGMDPSFVRLAWVTRGADPYAHVLVSVPVQVDGRVLPLLLDASYHGNLQQLLARAATAHVHRPVSRQRNRVRHL
jgi:hypothetical protein